MRIYIGKCPKPFFEIFIRTFLQVFQSVVTRIDVCGVKRKFDAMNTKQNDTRRASDQEQERDDGEPPLEIDARRLLGRRREATIIHAGERYRLRVTSNNKLILTK